MFPLWHGLWLFLFNLNLSLVKKAFELYIPFDPAGPIPKMNSSRVDIYRGKAYLLINYSGTILLYLELLQIEDRSFPSIVLKRVFNPKRYKILH